MLLFALLTLILVVVGAQQYGNPYPQYNPSMFINCIPSTATFKATLILEECPPCPPGFTNALGGGNGGYGGQQPALSNPYSTNQRLFNPYPWQQGGGGALPPYPQQPGGGQMGGGYSYGPQQPYAPPGTLSSGLPQQPWNQGQMPYGGGGGGGNVGGGQMPYVQPNTGYGQTSASYGQQMPPYPQGAGLSPYGPLRSDAMGGFGMGGQPGYLPNYRGDRYTNPQRIQETRSLNEPFYQSIGGEPHYPGGADNPTPSQQQMGPLQPQAAATAAKTAVKDKERRHKRHFPLII